MQRNAHNNNEIKKEKMNIATVLQDKCDSPNSDNTMLEMFSKLESKLLSRQKEMFSRYEKQLLEMEDKISSMSLVIDKSNIDRSVYG